MVFLGVNGKQAKKNIYQTMDFFVTKKKKKKSAISQKWFYLKNYLFIYLSSVSYACSEDRELQITFKLVYRSKCGTYIITF